MKNKKSGSYFLDPKHLVEVNNKETFSNLPSRTPMHLVTM